MILSRGNEEERKKYELAAGRLSDVSKGERWEEMRRLQFPGAQE